MYRAVLPSTGPTTMTTFGAVAAAAGPGWAATVVPRARTRARSGRTSSWILRVEDARWAPLVWNGKTLASSLPEHRAEERDDGRWCRRRQKRGVVARDESHGAVGERPLRARDRVSRSGRRRAR